MSAAMTDVQEASAQPVPPQPIVWQEATRQFAQILKLDVDPPEAVLRRAVVDTTFAHRLLVSRNAPHMLAALLADPANARFASEDEPTASAVSVPQSQGAEAPSGVAMLGRATAALARWATTGFSHADEETLARRLAACKACPNARAGADTLANRVAGAVDATVCSLCGCPVARKARMSTESCPGQDPAHPGLTRWGDSLAA